MKKITLLLSLALCLVQAVAQQKLLSIEDAVLKQRTTLAPERLSQLQWIPNTPIFSYVGKKNAIELLLGDLIKSWKCSRFMKKINKF